MSSAGRSETARKLALVPILVILALAWALAPSAPAVAGPALGAGGPLPLSFEPNQGQADAAVRFLARGRGYGLFLTPTETVLVLATGDRRGALARRPGPIAATPNPPAVLRMRFVGADAGASITGVTPLPGRSHHFVGASNRWRRDVPTFARVRYTEVYPGVSLVFYGNERELEYDVVVAPGADPSVVELAFDGADLLRLAADGDLVITTAGGEVRMRRPVVYQDTEAGRRPIEGGYVVDGARVRFRLAAWDASRPLVIDPVLGYSTYLGGGSNDQGFGIAVDGAGNAYVTGSTISTDFPVSSTPAQATRGGDVDVFVAKLDPTGTTLLYSTYLGGSGADAGNAIAVDADGNAYVTGTTLSNNFPVFPVPGAFQSTTRGASEAFVTKLDPNGNALVYSTYLGSTTDDFAFGIALDAAGNAYVTGSTASAGFPNNNAITCLGTKRTGSDAFVAKVNAAGSTLGYCRFIGGAGEETGAAVAADGAGAVWVAGSTTSADLPVQSAFQSTRGGGTDGFVGRLDALGALVYLTYLGGAQDDDALAMVVDATGNAYVTGSTASTNFPTATPVQPARGGSLDAFVTKLDPTGTALVLSTYLGGSGNDVGNGIGVHPGDATIYVAGSTSSVDFPTLSPIQDRLNGGLDAFVAKLNTAGTVLVYSTYLGGTGDDAAQALAVDADGVAVLTGTTESPTFPTLAPIQSAAGLMDAFVTQVADGGIIQFTGVGYQVNENAGSVTIGVQRTGDVSGAVTVEFVTSDGTATAGADYLSASGILAFAPGQVVATFPVTITNDAVGDGDETVTLTVRNPQGGAVLGGRRVATLTIVDDEPAINFSADTYQVTENRGPAAITVTRSGPTGGSVTVQFATSNGSATSGSDYTAVTRTLTFAPGARSATVSVPILNDTLAEGTETVNVTLSNVNGGTPPALLGVRATATLNVLDEDVAGSVQFSAPTYTLAERGANATITVTRIGGTAGGVTVDYATSDGTATAGADYTPTTGTLTFGAGVASQTFRIPVLDDALPEGAETVSLALANPGGGASLGGRSTAVLTITDDEPTVFFSAEVFTVREGTATAPITVRRAGTVTGAATVDFTTADGTARAGIDYRALAGTLTFAAGVTTRTFSVAILNDTSAAGQRTVLLALSNATGAATIALPSTAVLTITEDDAAGVVQFSADAFSAAENAGSAVVTVSRAGGTAGGATIGYATSDGTATPLDYTFASGVLTFGPGETIKSFTVPLLDDPLAEGVETVNLTLSSAGGGATVGTRSTAVLRIIDDELGLSFSGPIYTVAEGAASATITVELTGVNTVPVTVNYTTGNGTASAGLDYTTAAGTLVFPPGGSPTIGRTRTFTVPILPDTLAEGTESVTLTIGNPTPTGVAQLVPGRSAAVLNVTDDDQAGTIGFDTPTFSVSESVGTATIRVKRSLGLASGVTVDYATSNGTAAAGLDYTASAGRLTFGAGETIKTFAIPITNDALGEGPETVTLALANPGGGGTLAVPVTAELTIADDEPHVMLSAATYSVSESAGSVTVTVLRGGVDTATLTVDYATADQVPVATGKAVGGVDYTPVSRTLTFAPGVRSRTFTVPILNDATPEPEEAFDVALRNPAISAGPVALGAPSRAVVRITDNDLGGIIQFSAPAYSVNEHGGEVVVTVVRAGGEAAGVSVLFETGEAFPAAPGTVPQTATPNADYTPAAANARVTFGAGETSKIVRIPILIDTDAEGVETLNVRISDPKPGAVTLGPQATASVSIVDEQQTVQYARAEFTALEGSAAAAVTVERTGPPRRLRVDYATGDLAGCTAASGCYSPATGTLTFEPTMTSQSFNVRLGDPSTIEPDRSFQVSLSSLRDDGGAAVSVLGPRDTATVKVKDNDRGGAFSVTGTTVNERDGGATVVVSRTGGAGGPVTVDFVAARCGLNPPPACDFPARQTGSPGLPQHFVPDARTLTFQAGEMSQVVRVTIVDNTIAEGSRSFGVSIRNAQPGVLQDGQPIGPQIAAGDALVNIVEDELSFVTLSAETYSSAEATQQILIPVVRSGSPSVLGAPLTVDVVAVSDGSRPAVVSLDYTGGLGFFAGSVNGYAPAPGFLPAPSPGFCPPGDIVARQSLTFAANQTTQNFLVPYLDETAVDGTKTIIVCINDTVPRNSLGGPGIAFPAAATLSVADDDIGGSIEFAAATYVVAEDVAGGSAIITLTRTGNLALASAVTVVGETGDLLAATTPPQTAVAGADYASTSATVTFGAGAATQSFAISISNPGGSPNGVKTVNLQLRSPAATPGGGAGPSLGTRSTAVLRIVDATQTVAFTLPNYDVSEAAGMVTIAIERTGDVSGPLTVAVATADGAGPAPAAVAGVDYQAVNEDVTFGPQQSVATVTVPIIGNNVVALDKTFNVSVSGPGVDPAGRVDATVTIEDDDLAGTIAFAPAGFVIQENGGEAEVTISRSGGTAGCPLPLAPTPPSCPDATLVTFSTANGTATAGATPGTGDYDTKTETIEFGVGELVKTVRVTINPDAAIEGAETVTLGLSNPMPTGAGVAGRGPTVGPTATLQILETEVRISATAFTVGEGTGRATLTLVRTGDLSAASLVSFATADQTTATAVGGTDYTATTGTLTFAPGESVQTFDVVLTDESVAESDESFDVVFSVPVGGNATIARDSCDSATPATGTVATCTVVVTILDNESGGVLSFGQPVYDVTEPAGVTTTATVTVRRLVGGAGNITVVWDVIDGTAMSGTHVVVPATVGARTLSFGPGESSQTFTVTVLPNSTVGVQTATLALRSATGGAVIAVPGTATLRIIDRDNSIGFDAPAYTAAENAGTAAVTVRRTGTVGTVTVEFTTAPGSAVAPGDFTALTGTLTFPPGTASRTIAVPIVNDALLETNETFTLTLSNVAVTPGAALVQIAPDSCANPGATTTCSAPVAIVDDDQGGVIQFASATYGVSENAGTATVALARSGGLAGGVTVTLATTPASSPDFSLPSGTVTFAPGQSTATAALTIVNNAVAEADRTVLLTISTPQPTGLANSPLLGVQTAATLTILDDEPRVTFTAPSFSVAEGAGVATITLQRIGTPSAPLTVAYATSDGSAGAPADYTATSGTVTFAPGVLSQSFTVPIVNDNVVDGSESLTLTLSNAVGAGIDRSGCALALPAPPALATTCIASLQIVDDDQTGTIAFNASTYTANEPATGAPASTLVVTVTRTGGNAGGISVQYAAVDGTASNGTDFVLAPGSVTFGVNETARTFTVSVPDNPGSQGNRTFRLVLANPTLPAAFGTPSQATVTIVDDDQTVKFSALGYSVLEGQASAAIVVERLGTPTGTVTVRLSTSNGSATTPAHYAAVNRTLTFGPGVRMQTVPIPVVNNRLVDSNRRFNVTLDTLTSTGGTVALVRATCATAAPVTDPVTACTVPVDIVDEDHGGTIQFSAATYTVTEGTPAATIRLVRTGGVGGPVTVDFTTVDGMGSAAAGTDYTSVSRTVTFAAGVTAQNVTIPIINDTLAEPSKSVPLSLSGPTGGANVNGPRRTATLTIVSNDTAGAMQFSQPVYTVAENVAGGLASIILSRTGGAASGVSVRLSTADGPGAGGGQAGVDYTTVSTTVTFGAGQTTQTATVPILDGAGAEGVKPVLLALSSPGGGGTLGPRATAVLNVVDDEATVGFTVAENTVNEGSPATITVARTGPLTGTVTVAYATSDDTATATGPLPDYRTASGVLTFGPGVKTRSFTVPTITDVRDEGASKIVNLTLSAPTGAALGRQSASRLTLVENDVAGTFRFRAGAYQVAETAGFRFVQVERVGGAAGPVMVDYATVDGSARAGVDYTAKSGTITMAPTVFLVNLVMPVLNNPREDGARSFSVRLSVPAGGTGGAAIGTPNTTVVTITDDDEGGALQFGAATYIVNECAALPCEAVLTVGRTGGTASGISVDFATADGTATALNDYVATTGTLNFAAGVLFQTIRIPLQIEPGAEPTKAFSVQLANPRGGATLGSRSGAQVQIRDTR